MIPTTPVLTYCLHTVLGGELSVIGMDFVVAHYEFVAFAFMQFVQMEKYVVPKFQTRETQF